jgi:hypothetical protein
MLRQLPKWFTVISVIVTSFNSVTLSDKNYIVIYSKILLNDLSTDRLSRHFKNLVENKDGTCISKGPRIIYSLNRLPLCGTLSRGRWVRGITLSYKGGKTNLQEVKKGSLLATD